MPRLFPWLYHFIAYYVTWVVCIAFAAKNDPWIGTVIALLLVFSQVVLQAIMAQSWRLELLFAFALMVAGILIDTFLMYTGLIVFNANPLANMLSPPWLACLWLSFGFTITITSRAWLHRYVILGILTFISLPFAYWVATIINVATVMSWWFYPLLGGIWMVLLPVLLHYYLHFDGAKQ